MKIMNNKNIKISLTLNILTVILTILDSSIVILNTPYTTSKPWNRNSCIEKKFRNGYVVLGDTIPSTPQGRNTYSHNILTILLFGHNASTIINIPENVHNCKGTYEPM